MISSGSINNQVLLAESADGHALLVHLQIIFAASSKWESRSERIRFDPTPLLAIFSFQTQVAE